MDNNQNNKPKITNINTMLEISNSVLLDRDSGDWTEWESMKKTNQKKRKKKRQGVRLGRFSGLFSWSHSPLKAAVARSGIVAWKTMPDSG